MINQEVDNTEFVNIDPDSPEEEVGGILSSLESGLIADSEQDNLEGMANMTRINNLYLYYLFIVVIIFIILKYNKLLFINSIFK